MTLPNHRVRRATIDDLPKLIPLWNQENLPVHELEKRFKEFQVAEAEGGELIGALGVKIAGPECLVHGEAFAHPEQADALRTKLWDRSLVLIKNHGLARVWTQLSSPFWNTNGFQVASAELLTKVPVEFAGNPAPWRYLQLREMAAPAVSIDKEFALFKEAEQESTQRIFRQAKVLKMVAGVVAAIVLLLVLVWAFLFFQLPMFKR